MRTIYIKVGEPLDDDQIYVYEAIILDNFIRILMPGLTYPACMAISRDIDNPAYVVEGRYMGKEKYGQHILRDYKIVSKLTYDKENDNYIYNDKIEPPKPKIETEKEFVIEKPNFSKTFQKKDLTKNENNRTGSIGENRFVRDDTGTALLGQGIGRLIGLMTHRK